MVIFYAKHPLPQPLSRERERVAESRERVVKKFVEELT
jgi:hypothetical protein